MKRTSMDESAKTGRKSSQLSLDTEGLTRQSISLWQKDKLAISIYNLEEQERQERKELLANKVIKPQAQTRFQYLKNEILQKLGHEVTMLSKKYQQKVMKIQFNAFMQDKIQKKIGSSNAYFNQIIHIFKKNEKNHISYKHILLHYCQKLNINLENILSMQTSQIYKDQDFQDQSYNNYIKQINDIKEQFDQTLTKRARQKNRKTILMQIKEDQDVKEFAKKRFKDGFQSASQFNMISNHIQNRKDQEKQDLIKIAYLKQLSSKKTTYDFLRKQKVYFKRKTQFMKNTESRKIQIKENNPDNRRLGVIMRNHSTRNTQVDPTQLQSPLQTLSTRATTSRKSQRTSIQMQQPFFMSKKQDPAKVVNRRLSESNKDYLDKVFNKSNTLLKQLEYLDKCLKNYDDEIKKDRQIQIRIFSMLSSMKRFIDKKDKYIHQQIKSRMRVYIANIENDPILNLDKLLSVFTEELNIQFKQQLSQILLESVPNIDYFYENYQKHLYQKKVSDQADQLIQIQNLHNTLMERRGMFDQRRSYRRR